MRSRAYRRNQNPNRRKAIGAVVVGGVLVAAGLAGVQLASASTTPKAADVITVEGQQFDVSQCTKLEIKAADVLCDGEKLAPELDYAPLSPNVLKRVEDALKMVNYKGQSVSVGGQAVGLR